MFKYTYNVPALAYSKYLKLPLPKIWNLNKRLSINVTHLNSQGLVWIFNSFCSLIST